MKKMLIKNKILVNFVKIKIVQTIFLKLKNNLVKIMMRHQNNNKYQIVKIFNKIKNKKIKKNF